MSIFNPKIYRKKLYITRIFHDYLNQLIGSARKKLLVFLHDMNFYLSFVYLYGAVMFSTYLESEKEETSLPV